MNIVELGAGALEVRSTAPADMAGVAISAATRSTYYVTADTVRVSIVQERCNVDRRTSMDNNIIVAIIGASATVIAAAIGGVVGRSDILDRIFAKGRFPRLAGTRWKSTWLEEPQDKRIQKEETFVFTRQKRGRVYGYITMDSLPDLKWDIEGNYNDRFLRLFWQPSLEAKNKFFLDYGVYFFERRGSGSFDGYAIGFDLDTNKIEIATHQLQQLPG